MKEFNKKVKEHVGAFDGNLILQTEEDNPEEEVFDPTSVDGLVPIPYDDNNMEDPDTPGFDPLVKAQVVLTHKEGDMMATVLSCKQDADGNLIGRKHRIPALDSRVYEVKFLG
jgi:hypothetical protein